MTDSDHPSPTPPPAGVPDFSVVIVNYNTRDLLLDCLDSITATKGEVRVEVILVDNGSVDGSVEAALERYPGLIALPQDDNLGYVPANNIGMEKATGRYLMYLNNDTVVEPGCFQILRDFLDAHPEACAAGPQILNPDRTDQGAARMFPTLMTGLFGRRSTLSRWFPNNRWTRYSMVGQNRPDDEPFECHTISAACLVVRTGLAKELGGLDEDFTLYWCDCELLARMRRRGHSVWCLPQARIIHYEGHGGSTRSFRQRMKMTVAFNRDSYLCYVRGLDLSPWHPAALLCAALLTARTGVKILVQLLRPDRATSSRGEQQTT